MLVRVLDNTSSKHGRTKPAPLVQRPMHVFNMKSTTAQSLLAHTQEGLEGKEEERAGQGSVSLLRSGDQEPVHSEADPRVEVKY